MRRAPPGWRLRAPVDAVIFDFDGTLVASRERDRETLARLLATDASLAPGVASFWAHEGEPIGPRVQAAWPGREAELRPEFEREEVPPPYPGVRRLLERLRRRGLRLAVVSSRRRQAVLAGLAATGLDHPFSVVIGLEDVRAPKPSPEGLIAALRRLGVPAARAIYVGDSWVDVEAGRQAGVTVWQAAWEPSTAPALAVTLDVPAQVDDRLRRLAGPRGPARAARGRRSRPAPTRPPVRRRALA
jgi:HAD superfamily hydrolase (TIGR01509 family)